MKKIILLIIINIICSTTFSQDIEQNLKKYWHFRDRLEQSYMIVGSPEKQGTNWPAQNRNWMGVNFSLPEKKYQHYIFLSFGLTATVYKNIYTGFDLSLQMSPMTLKYFIPAAYATGNLKIGINLKTKNHEK
jgi:hypothetical protein